MPSFYNELQRRNVLRVAAAYAMVAWILIESGSVLLPTFGAPEWFFKVYVIIVIGGFVVSLIFAWVFEITPDGVKLEKDVDRSNYKPEKRGRLNVVLIGLLAIALAISLTFNITGIRGTGIESLRPDKLSSVAVLPFKNRSADPENGFFADGIHDDLLSRLSGIDALHVISSTSVSEYRDTTKGAPVIGEELGVEAIVEGAVQRAGDQVRVTVSLIDVSRDEPIWSDTYDRDFAKQSIFDLQSEISREVTAALRASLTPEERNRLDAIKTDNVEANALFVKGQIRLDQRQFDSLQAARDFFEQAIALDPNYSEAWSALAETVMVLYNNHQAIGPSEARNIASNAVQKALTLDPGNAEAYAVQGLIETNLWSQTRVGDGNIRAAESFRRAIELNSNLANAYVWFSMLRENENDVDAAIELLKTAIRKDPRSRASYLNIAGLFALKGDNDESTRLLLHAIDFFPDWELPIGFLSQHLQKLGRLDEALAWSVEQARLSDDPLAGANAVGIYRIFGHDEAIIKFMQGFPDDHPASPIGIAYERFVMGDYAGTLSALKGVESDSVGANSLVVPLRVRAMIKLEDYDQARALLVRANPKFLADERASVDRFNLTDAVMLAFVELQLGNEDPANRLLGEALPVTETLPRVGWWGHGIRDVQILILQGRIPAALDRLRDAIDEGVVGEMPFDYWDVVTDPIMAPLLDEERFIEMLQDVAAQVETMDDNVRAAAENDDWQSLRNKTYESLSAALQ